jgi:hypothetical protein
MKSFSASSYAAIQQPGTVTYPEDLLNATS